MGRELLGGQVGIRKINLHVRVDGQRFIEVGRGIFQLQIIDGTDTKCVNVKLTQIGSDIYGTAMYAKYVATTYLGFDFDSGGTGMPVVTTDSGNGYGVKSLAVVFVSQGIQRVFFFRLLCLPISTHCLMCHFL